MYRERVTCNCRAAIRRFSVALLGIVILASAGVCRPEEPAHPLLSADTKDETEDTFPMPAIVLVENLEEATAVDLDAPEDSTAAVPPAPAEASESPPQKRPQNNGPTESERLGQAPEDTSLLFLRRSTPLLEPGQWELDFGLSYSFQEFEGLTVLPDNSLSTGRVRTRRLTVPLAVRYGWSKRMQPFLNLPVGLAHLERADLARDEITSVVGVGDLTMGFNYLLHQSDSEYPDVIGGLTVGAPTGAHPFELSPGPAALGSGFWSVTGNVLLVKSVDPAVIFGGIGYSHQFDESYLGLNIDPGEVFFYSFGSGFAINDKLTLTTSLFGSYQTNTKVNNRSISNSGLEPISMRFSLTASKSRCLIIEPFAAFGLTEDAPDARVGINFTRRF